MDKAEGSVHAFTDPSNQMFEQVHAIQLWKGEAIGRYSERLARGGVGGGKELRCM